MTNNSKFPELYILFKFDSLKIKTLTSGVDVSLKLIHFSTNTISLVETNPKLLIFPTSKFIVSNGFYRLNIVPNINKYYSNSDLTDETDFICSSPNEYCYKDSTPINCATNYFYSYSNSTCLSSCPSETMTSYNSVDGSNINSSYCIKPCGGTTGTTCISTDTYSDYPTQYTCENSFFLTYLTCLSPSINKSEVGFYFGSYFNSQKISIPITQNYSNYIIEFWYFVDRKFIPSSVLAGYNYIFITSGPMIFRDSNYDSAETYRIWDNDSSNISSSFTLSYGNWYRLYLQKSDTSVKLYYNEFSNYISISTKSSLNLSGIYFCHGVPCGPIETNVNWFTGYYEYLRVWNGNEITITTLKAIEKK